MAKEPIPIKRFLRDGNLDVQGVTDTEELIEAACGAMDRAYTWEVFGDVIFEGEDGKTYVLTLEAHIGEANPEYVKDVLAEDDEDEE